MQTTSIRIWRKGKKHGNETRHSSERKWYFRKLIKNKWISSI